MKPVQDKVSPLEHAHAPYFVQKVAVGEELMGRSRMDVFGPLCEGKRVLHVGCVDWPITDLKNSLHLQLEPLCAQLDGFDINTEAFAQMQPHLKGRLFSRWEDVTDAYDLVLVPEVLEHVPDVQGFLQSLNTVDAASYVLTVPDAWSCWRQHFDYSSGAQTFVEVVHPDHNCWYTPYTLTNVLKKYTPWSIEGMWFFNRMSLLVAAHKEAPAEEQADEAAQ